MKKIIQFVIVGMVGLVSLVGCGSSDDEATTKKKELVVLTSSGYQPYETIDAKGNLEGFDIDVMNEAAKILGYTVKWQDMDFDGIISSLNVGEGDLAIAGITVTPEREEVVDFSEQYFAVGNTRNVALVKDDGVLNETKDLKGKKIGVQFGSIQAELAYQMEESYDLEVESLKSYAPLVEEVKNGIIDGMFVEEPIAKKLMEQNDGLKYFDVTEGKDIDGNAIAFKKGSSLKAEFNDAIAQMKENGTMDKLIDKWFK